ncbi:MAG: hypothetical protein AB4042_07475 [Leptolyngbyaceae cyanobacterium]
MLTTTPRRDRSHPPVATASRILGYGLVGLLAIDSVVAGSAIAISSIPSSSVLSLSAPPPGTSLVPPPTPDAHQFTPDTHQSTPDNIPSIPPTSAPTLDEASTQPLAPAEVPVLRPLPDGTYLYGQSPYADTVGATYMVFDVKGQDVVGAFYMPYSSFDCFRGSFQVDALALTIRDSYEQNVFTHTVPLVDSEAIASTQGLSSIPQSPDGFHAIADLSETDQHILSTCRAQSW